MFETIFDLIRDPGDFANWMAFFEIILALAAVVVGLIAVIGFPALRLPGVLVAALGAAGLVFGHL